MKPGEIFSYMDMCQFEKVNLQRGMNFKMNNGISILLMSQRENAPYSDTILEEGKILIYEGHDIQKNYTDSDPK